MANTDSENKKSYQTYVKNSWAALMATYKKERPEEEPLKVSDLLEAFSIATENYLPQHELANVEPDLLDSKIMEKAEILMILQAEIKQLQANQRNSLMRPIDPINILQKRMNDPKTNTQKAKWLKSFLQGSITEQKKEAEKTQLATHG
jgi:hypothetical protein